MKHTTQSPNFTSFHGDVIRASVNDLKAILGQPANDSNTGEGKVNFEWVMETDAGGVFTVYDWKEYRPISEDELIEWHIGGHNGETTKQALNEIAGSLNELQA